MPDLAALEHPPCLNTSCMAGIWPGLASVSKAMDSDVSTNHVQMRTDPTASGVAPTARNVDHI